MVNEFQGEHKGAGLRIAIVLSRFNVVVGDRLLAGALSALLRAGVDKKQIDIYKVPGAFEIATIATELTRAGKHDAVVCLGAVVRGETPHFVFICAEAARGIANAALAGAAITPVLFGVLTTDNVQQAMERSGGRSGNKGEEAAIAAVEMATLLGRMRGKQAT